MIKYNKKTIDYDKIIIGESMINISKQFNDIMQQMYESERITVDIKHSYEEVMQSNLTRLKFINGIFKNIEKGKLSEEYRYIFDQNVDFIFNYFNGNYRTELTIPDKYNKDKEYCLIIPSQEDMQFLFSLIDLNVELYNTYYKNNEFILELPNRSFNMNMERRLTVKWKNLAHLLGLTQTELEPDKNKNLLKKHILSVFECDKEIEDSSNLLNILLTEDGRKELLRINQLTLDFIEKDRKKYPNCYDSEGNIKIDSFETVRERFKSDPQNQGLDFPIIRYSRYITKCINNINYFNMTNTTQMILDYNAPIGENDEKDIFVLNVDNKLLEKDMQEYLELKKLFREVMKHYGKNKEDNEKIEEQIFTWLIPKNANNINKKKSEIRSYLNLYQTEEYVGKHGITPNLSYIENKIRDFLSASFKANIHLIGFGTEFKKNDSNEIILTSLKEKVSNSSHCDTSIFLNVAELIDKYYKRGRAFFIDKVTSSLSPLKYVRISNPIEELSFLKQRNKLENYDLSEYNKLSRALNSFNKKYYAYKNQKTRKR